MVEMAVALALLAAWLVGRPARRPRLAPQPVPVRLETRSPRARRR